MLPPNHIPETNKKTGISLYQKAKLSEVMDHVREDGMQMIVRNRKELPRKKRTLLEFFEQAPCPDIELDIQRSEETLRDIDL